MHLFKQGTDRFPIFLGQFRGRFTGEANDLKKPPFTKLNVAVLLIQQKTHNFEAVTMEKEFGIIEAIIEIRDLSKHGFTLTLQLHEMFYFCFWCHIDRPLPFI